MLTSMWILNRADYISALPFSPSSAHACLLVYFTQLCSGLKVCYVLSVAIGSKKISCLNCLAPLICVSVVRDSEGDGRVTPAHMRVCAPGLRSWVRVSTHSYPGGGAGGYPQVRRPWGPARGRDAGTRCLGTCVYPYAAETRVLG